MSTNRDTPKLVRLNPAGSFLRDGTIGHGHGHEDPLMIRGTSKLRAVPSTLVDGDRYQPVEQKVRVANV